MRAGAVVMAALALAALVPPVEAVASLEVALLTPMGAGTGAAIPVSGRVYLAGEQGMPRASVTLLVDGAPVASAQADNNGRFTAALPPIGTPGDVTVHAQAQAPGGILAGESFPRKLMVRERPLPPQQFVIALDATESTTYASWFPTPDTRGAPLLGYKLTRQSGLASSVVAVLDPSTLSFTDEQVVWNVTYRYFAQATTFAGDSAPSEVREVALPPATPASLSAQLTKLERCDSSNCAALAPGTYTFQGPRLTLRPGVHGQAATAAGELVRDVAVDVALDVLVACDACTPRSGTHAAQVRTGALGAYESRASALVWADYAPDECRDFALHATSRAAPSLVASATAQYRFCRGG